VLYYDPPSSLLAPPPLRVALSSGPGAIGLGLSLAF
jgi:hypothetical protein